jgi:hypothetical protein
MNETLCREQNGSIIRNYGSGCIIRIIRFAWVIVDVVVDGVGIVYLTEVGLGLIKRH